MDRLPVELLYEIHLFALSETLPCTNSHLRAVFTATSTSHRVSYLIGLYERNKEEKSKHGRSYNTTSTRGPIAHALLFPLCTERVLDALFAYYASRPPDPRASRLDSWTKETPLPKRLFSTENMPPTISPSSSNSNGVFAHKPTTPPLPFLRHLYSLFSTHNLAPWPDANAHNGYALTRAVFVGHLPLVSFLLTVAGAKPGRNDALAVRVAIRKRDLKLVELLVEGGATAEQARIGSKRRRISDRVDVNAGMLREAVEVGAKDIVRYLLHKGARPDMQVMAQMLKSGFV